MENLIKSDKAPFDIRGEVLARLIVEKYDLQTEQALFRPRDYFQRWGRKDVLEVSEGYSEGLGKEVFWLDLSREGMFDALPESIFLHPDDDYPDDTYRVKKLSEQEAAARKFLLPFEQLFYWLRLENERNEARSENELEDWWRALLNDGHWASVGSTLDAEQQKILTQMTPYLSDIVGAWSSTEQWLSIFLKTDIKIVEAPPPNYPLPPELQKRTGEGILGRDFVIGDHFSDGIPIAKIVIERLTCETLSHYLPGGNARVVLEELLSVLLPVEIPYEIALGLAIPSDEFYLGEERKSAILGHTTCIQ